MLRCGRSRVTGFWGARNTIVGARPLGAFSCCCVVCALSRPRVARVTFRTFVSHGGRAGCATRVSRRFSRLAAHTRWVIVRVADTLL